MSVLSLLMRDLDEEVRRSAVAESIRREEGPPPGRYGFVTREDLEATRHRIVTGLPKLPMACWRW